MTGKSKKRKMGIDILMTVDVLLLMLSGIAMSNYVFRFLSFHSGMSLARRVHMTAAYLGFLLMSFHIGLHVVSIYGIYALYKRNFLGYISGSVMFAFFDYAELPVDLLISEGIIRRSVWIGQRQHGQNRWT